MAGSKARLSRPLSASTVSSAIMRARNAWLGLCSPAPQLRRGERQERCLGARYRRHGCDHPGHGERRHHPWRGHQAFDAGAPGYCGKWPRRRRRDGQGRDNPCRGRCRRNQSQAPLPRPCRSACLARGISAAHGELALRLGHISHERRTFRIARLHSVARKRVCRAPCLGHHHRAKSRLHGAGLFRRAVIGWSRSPIVELVIPSTLDDTLAPRGLHVASLFCQHVAPQLPDGSSWDDHRETVADLMIETVDKYAPNFRRSVLARQILSPLDLERTFGLVGGDIFHGSLDLRQLFSARPMLGHADYRGPIAGLYLCGSGGHPGGGVTGAPGHNAAREILRDFRRKRVSRSIAKRVRQ